MRRIGLLFILGFLTGWAHGATYYVATTGSDSNPCSLAQPCATPAHAFNSVAVAGDTVLVSAGTYDNGASEIHFNTTGSSGNPVTLKCVTRGACKLQNSITGNNTVVSMNGDYQVIDGFEITNTGSGNNLGIFVFANHETIIHNIVHHIEAVCTTAGGGGISGYINTMLNTVVDSNLVYDIGWTGTGCSGGNTVHGINFEPNGPGTAVITNNIIYHVLGGWGIQMTGKAIGTTGTVIANNLIFSNGNGGIVMAENGGSGSIDYNIVSNNIIVDNGTDQAKCGIFEFGPQGTHNTYRNNDAFGNAGGNYCFSTGSQTGGISVDPSSGTTFINWQADGSGDYREKAGSPTIATGTSTGAPNHDYAGNPRPSGSGYDMGAYQVAHTWFIRANGGTRQQCTGQSDTAYPGSGTNQPCAFNDFRYMWSPNDGTGGAGTWIAAGGDTVVVRGCKALPSQANPSDPACRLGWDIGTNGNPPNSWCPGVGSYTCYNPTIPAGSSGQHTRILAGCAYDATPGPCNTGNVTNRANLTQLFGGFSLQFALNFSATQWVDFQGFELTTHNGACSHHGAPAYPRSCATSQPLDDYSDNGLLFNNTTSHILLQDVYIDGFESNGTFGPIGGPITITRANVSFNVQAGMQFDDGSSTPDASGSQLLMSYVTGIGNGCKQQYPIVNASWPALACWDDNSGGFGDFLSGQNTTLDVLTFDHGFIFGNTKDAFIGPHTQVAALTITNSYSGGNMGAQWKWGGAVSSTVLFQNNLTNMYCGRQRETMPGAAQNFNISTGLGGSYLSDYCRAGGDGFSSPTRATSTNHVYGNTFIGANATMFDFGCGYVDGTGAHPETTCGTSPWIFKDNVILGYTPPENSGQAPGQWFFDPTFGGSSIVLTADHNDYFGTRNISPDVCGTNSIMCADPQLNSQPSQTWVSEATLDVFNPPVVGNSYYPLSGSPIRGAGVTVAGLTADYYGTTRPSPPAMGGVELSGVLPVAATPTCTPAGGTYAVTQTVTCSSTTPSSTTYCTIDGSTPTTGSPVCTSISVASSLTLKAISAASGFTNSSINNVTYTITPIVPVVTMGGQIVITGNVKF